MKLVKIKETNKYDYVSNSNFDSNTMIDLSSNIYYWDDYLNQEDCKIDCIKVKEVMEEQYNNKGFDGFKDTEKILLCKYFVPTNEEIDSVVDYNTKKQLKAQYDSMCVLARQKRFLYAQTEFKSRILDTEQQSWILNDIARENLVFKYVNFGVKGKSQGDNEAGVYDYILGVEDFVGAGLKDKEFTNIVGDITAEQLADRLIYILNTGDLLLMGYTG